MYFWTSVRDISDHRRGRDHLDILKRVFIDHLYQVDMYSSVLITYPDKLVAKMISRELIDMRLAACVNLFPIESAFRWEGGVMEESEVAAVYKIRTVDFTDLRSLVLRRHPYRVPCIVRYDIAEGYLPYMEWIRESTARLR